MFGSATTGLAAGGRGIWTTGRFDARKVIDSEDVLIELKAPNKPGVLRAGTDFTYVVMPVNLQ